MQEPERRRELTIGMVNFLVVFSVVLGGLATGMFILGSGFAIVGIIVLALWGIFFWRWILNLKGLWQGRW